MKFKVDEYGLTLVEGLIALSIATVVGALLLVIMVNTGGLFYQQSSKLEQGLNINDALGAIGQTIKESSSVAASYPSVPPPNFTSGTKQLVLKVPSIDASSDIISNIFDYFVFFLDQGSLRFKTFPDPQSSRKAQDQIFSTKVESLFFQYYDSQIPPQEVTPTSASKIKVTLQLKQKAGAGIEQNIATKEANLRND